MSNIDSIINDNEYELKLLLTLMRNLRDTINTATPHVPYKHALFSEIKDWCLHLVNQHRVFTISNDCQIIDKSIILQNNITIIKNRIYSVINTINNNNII
jgi:hypothetical protein